MLSARRLRGVAHEVLFHPVAAADLDAIDDYIARDSPANAIAFVRRIRACCEGLATMPERGTRRDDLAPGVRTAGFERRVTIVFRIEGETVLILRILYGGRDVEALVREDPA